MNRDEVLDQYWIPFPAWNREEHAGWHPGRWSHSENTLLVMKPWGPAGSSEISRLMSPILRIHGLRSFLTAQEFIRALVPGDLVAWRLNPEGQVQDLQLFVPSERPPRSHSADPHLVKAWNEFLVHVRQFFRSKGFLEIGTPTLVACPGTEPYLDPVEVEGRYLPTSPELHLKKALAMGWGPCFEIRPCFRAGEISERHQPEFWMLEWYRPWSSLTEIEQDCRDLLSSLSSRALEFERQSMADLFALHLQKPLTPQTTRAELLTWAEELKLYPPKDESWDDLFNRIFVSCLERDLGSTSPLFLSDYPPEMAALARINGRGWADRFELYWKGLELANAFHELNDPREQRLRAAADNQKKKSLGKKTVSVDEDFFHALEEGMPPSGGIALGLERLFMALYDLRDFSRFRFFSES